MNDDTQTTLLIQMNATLGEIKAELKATNSRLENHENRLQKIEQNGNGSFKDDVVKLLVKAVLVSVCGFATIAGAGGVIAKIVGM